MSKDIIERLKECTGLAGDFYEDEILEAIAEIERLSKAVDAKIIEAGEMRLEIEHLRTTLGYLADNIDNPALVAVAETALKRGHFS